MVHPNNHHRIVLDEGLLIYEAWDAHRHPPSPRERYDAAGLAFRQVPQRLAGDPRLRPSIERLLFTVDPSWRSWMGLGDSFASLVAGGRVGLREVERDWIPLSEAGRIDGPDGPVPRDIPWLLSRRYIEIRVHDRDGAALTGLDYRLELPDGEALEGTLDEDARIRVDEITSLGSCRLTFPRLHHFARPLAAGRLPVADSETRSTYELDQIRSLATDTLHRVVLEPPGPQPATSYRGSIFGRGSAFPTAAVAPLLRAAQEWADSPETERQALGVFAHADHSGSDQLNKELTERRAEAVFALLTGNVDLFADLAERDGWGTMEHQAMLRGLGCNPGSIDGIVGAMTRAAVAAFRTDYQRDVFHRDVRPRRVAELASGDELDGPMVEALIDAYHAEYSVSVPEGRFWGPKHMGCGEFNPHSERSSIIRDRRVTLVQYREQRPREIDFPCTRGDASACAIDDGGVRSCRFFRESIADQEIDHSIPFIDLQWLRTPNGKARLSALTTLPDGDDLEFHVELGHTEHKHEQSDYGDFPGGRGERIATVTGHVRRGVAYAQWKPPPHYDPFEPLRWFEFTTLETERRFVLPEFQPPIFSIDGDDEHGEAWAHSTPPGRELRDVHFEGAVSGPITAIRNDGVLVFLEDVTRLSEVEDGHRVVGLLRAGSTVTGAEVD